MSLIRFGSSLKTAQTQSALIGRRGLALCQMADLDLPVPPGFILDVATCQALASGRMSDETAEIIRAGIDHIAQEYHLQFGDKAAPLLLSVRPSSPSALPGTLEAVLGIGLNDETVLGLGTQAADNLFAQECYRRFIQNYAHVVLGDDPAAFDDLLNLYLEEHGLVSIRELKSRDAIEIAQRFKAQIESNGGRVFPQDVTEQLHNSIAALARSWQSPRTKLQKKIHRLKEDAGLAIIVQAMVFGNRPEQSGAGKAASRNAQSGKSEVNGTFMAHSQGSDLDNPLAAPLHFSGANSGFAKDWNKEFTALNVHLVALEQALKNAVEVDFTLQQGKLWLLDVRPARRSTAAHLHILTDLVRTKHIKETEALLRINPLQLDQLLHATIEPSAKRDVIAQGLGASPGAATGMIIFDAEEARGLAAQGQAVILVKTETAPEDIKGLNLANGVLTTRGGMTSHAAVIARGMGKPCVAGASSFKIDRKEGTLKTQSLTLKQGDTITIDGSSGQVMRGEVALLPPSLSGDFATILSWADKTRRMEVRANAETPHDARLARDFGAQGIGLSRTEHMFFEGDRIIAMREMILADNEKQRRAALAQILPMLRDDFVELFSVMAGKPVCIRLLDPPLHEFLPNQTEEIEALAISLKLDPQDLHKRVMELREQNPMLGHRGVRLLLSYPEIVDMQARAIFEAVGLTLQKTGKAPQVEIMVPLVASREELQAVRIRIDAAAKDVAAETGHQISCLIGTMIELPRAALKAQDIAMAADFFSFGTNDLTQTTYGISRDDAGRFIGEYTKRGIFESDPFVTIDREGVGELIQFATDRGRQGKADLQLGICGEHGGDPDSIAFFEQVGLNYVSCSPFRVPIARLAAAQAFLRNSTK